MCEAMVSYSDVNERICRVCMTTSSFNLINIYDESNYHIIEKIKFCTDLLFTKGDGYPSQICRLCIENLSMAHKFKTKCLESDETFRKIIKEKNTHVENLKQFINTTIQQLNENNCKEDNVDKISVPSDNDESNEVEEVKTLQVEITIDDSEVDECKSSEECAEPVETQPSENPLDEGNELPKKRGRPKLSTSPFCYICDIKFTTKCEYEKHRRDVHCDVRTWQCEVCGKNFVHRPSLYVHMRSHRPPEFACDSCQYVTCYKYDLVKHKRIHTGDKLFKCEHCSQSFHNASNLRKHKIRQHEGGAPKFPCPRDNCKKAFHDRTELNFHLDSHDDVKRFKCDICQIELSRRNHWKKHMMRRHNVLVPPAKAGRRKTNLLQDSDSD